MSECERCGDRVVRRFTLRTRTETMTHRRTREVCAACHPSIRGPVERSGSAETVVADGGTPAGACPTCSGTMIRDGGSYTCVDCGWSSGR
ncbi:hypothetical protein [Haloterrigena alkaliphila]|uniref:Uncharacterized protein n=1 Tax=Haloterrigena alkaliphila TaxID=2816475 RepID=A0A8A2VBZ8_9EURY|nr:hypothetical protein [Haloterrigena alkaliphila]QSW99021.1 hypothetical protein J0X25_16805 [Haloterrigena alkaliphila]